MLFIDYDIILTYAVCIGITVLGLGIYRSMKTVRSIYLRLSARFLASGLVAFGSLLLLFFAGCGGPGGANSNPIFSPDHRYAVRVSDFDYGATGGDTSVSVFGDYGFRNATVLYGPWKIVRAKDIRWKSNSEVLIQFQPNTAYDPPNCKNLGSVKVTCVPRHD
jgi:hypothetical protein